LRAQLEHPWLSNPRHAMFHSTPIGLAIALGITLFDGSVRLARPGLGIGPQSPTPLILLERVQWLFDWPIHVLIIIGFVLLASNWKRLVVGYVTPVLTATVVLHSLKYLIGRARPELDVGAYAFIPLSDPLTKYDSLPSGHATTAFAMLTLIGIYAPWLRWPLWLLAGMLSALRVAQGMHFPGDVAFGALLGLATVAVSVRLLGPDCYRFTVAGTRDVDQPQLDPSAG